MQYHVKILQYTASFSNMVFQRPSECANFDQNKSLEETDLIITNLFLLLPSSVLNF